MLNTKDIAAAHAETPSCNAAATDGFFQHSLTCRTRAAKKGPAPVVLTVLEGGADEDRPDTCSRCEVCSLEVCSCPNGEHGDLSAAAVTGEHVLCTDCDVCNGCGTWLQRPGRGAPVVRGTGRYCSEACAEDDAEWRRAVDADEGETTDLPVESMSAVVEGRLR